MQYVQNPQVQTVQSEATVNDETSESGREMMKSQKDSVMADVPIETTR